MLGPPVVIGVLWKHKMGTHQLDFCNVKIEYCSITLAAMALALRPPPKLEIQSVTTLLDAQAHNSSREVSLRILSTSVDVSVVQGAVNLSLGLQLAPKHGLFGPRHK